MFSIFTKPRLIEKPISVHVRQKHKPRIDDDLHAALSALGPQDPLPTPQQAGYVPKSRDLVNDLRKAGL